MKCQFTLTVAEGKQLIAKAISSLPECSNRGPNRSYHLARVYGKSARIQNGAEKDTGKGGFLNRSAPAKSGVDGNTDPVTDLQEGDKTP